MMDITDSFSSRKPKESSDAMKILENKWRKKLRSSKVLLDPFSRNELKNLEGDKLNQELTDLLRITLGKQIKYVQQFENILKSKTTTFPKDIEKLEVTLDDKNIAISLESKTVPQLKAYIQDLIEQSQNEEKDAFITYKNSILKSNSNKKDYIEVAYFIKNNKNKILF
jgi:hypothetical protein